MDRVEQRRAAGRAALPPVTYPPDLPITAWRDDLLAAIAEHQVVVVAGETGSGKSTQLPKLCLELGRGIEGMIGHTQPRRIAARAVAERVAEELGTEVGGAVGFAVRFTDRTADHTLVKVMTDGILLAEIQRDRMLRAYDTLIIDEAHERSLNIDFLLGFLTQLLPKRRDLKVIITSATIDTAKFAAHFGGAPVVEVSGRSYPVEIRYRPIGGDEEEDGDRDQVTAIGDAVRELGAEGPGDVLVFLSGERDIRDTAEALGRLALPHTDVLPLYARLSAAEQHRVFAPHTGRRIVLATNVAETSLTVPGIRYVVDPGTARISRYNRRTKVQRLPIEPVSQASADQRAGRCGRVAPGVCIRLYDEDDLEARPLFTEPEILRTNLASVILQMAAAGLGDVERFPFVDPPDARSIADGVALLEELGALGGRDPVHLTKVGRRLARLPVDPRLGRMVLEADRLGCVREVLVIASALAIIDPRERPADQAQAAAEHHARFADPDSDFIAYLNLWRYLREQRQELSASQFRKRCRAEHLNWLRVREWEDVHSQLRQIAGGLGIHGSSQEADHDRIHQALLAGLLSHVGAYDREKQDYAGTRQARFTVTRGSALAKTRPAWVVAGELVETNRLWAHTVARIQPAWIEQVAGDRLKRSHGEPWWDDRRAAAVTEERVSLFGLEIARRRINLSRVDADRARELFVWHALVLGEWDTTNEFVQRMAGAVAEVRALEAKARRPDVLIDDVARFDLLDDRLPPTVTSGAAFDRWWRDHRLTDGDRYVPTAAELIDPAAGGVSPADFPDQWQAGELALPLTYRFEPGDPLDGVTVDVPVDVLNRFDGGGLDWQVPGHREDLVTALIRSLPKELRRRFVPVPEHVAAFLAGASPADGPLLEVLAKRLTMTTGDPVSPGSWRLDDVPAHLLVNYRAVDEGGRPLAWSKDLPALRDRLQAKVRAAVAGSAAAIEESGLTAWTIGGLPRVVETARDGRSVTAYPALVDEGETVGVRAFASAGEAAAAMRTGLRRLLLLGAGAPASRIRKALTQDVTLALASLPDISVAQVVDDVTAAAVDHLVAGAGGPVRDAVAFDRLLLRVREEVVDVAVAAATTVGRIAGRVAEVVARLAQRQPQPAVDDVRVQLRGLVHTGFVTESGIDRLRDIERYLHAVVLRLDRLPRDPARDRGAMAVVQALEDEWVSVASRDTGGEVRWMLEELRVSLFAQSLGTRGSVSEARVRKALAALQSRA